MSTITIDPNTDLVSCSCGTDEQDLFKVTRDHTTIVCLHCGATLAWPHPRPQPLSPTHAAYASKGFAPLYQGPRMNGFMRSLDPDHSDATYVLVTQPNSVFIPNRLDEPVEVLFHGLTGFFRLRFATSTAFLSAIVDA